MLSASVLALLLLLLLRFIRFRCVQGAKGIVVVDKNESGGQETVDLIKKSGFQNVVFQAADVSKSSDCEKFVSVAEKQFGGLHVLFNNAGIMHMEDDNAETTTDKVWDLTFNINVKVRSD